MQKSILTFLPFFLLFFLNKAEAQTDFYSTNTIQEVRIYFEQNNWDAILDSLYVLGEKDRMLCSVSLNGSSFDSVGIRYKGFSSVSTDRAKNPFNIKLDYVHKNQDYNGIEKIKLSNVIQDPSFLREVLSYEIARKYMPASKSNFAKVYINDVYWGLYTNVEAVNKDFVEKHYGSRQNSFFKCNPEDLDFDGENSNLGNSPGTDTTAYHPFYDKESEYGWAELYTLIETLNDNPEDIETVLNVDRALWMHAFNYALINFDSYIGYAQNYYVYKDDNGQFNPIIWDLNQSFASYRLADASEHFDGFSIAEAKTMDPLLHYNSVSVYPRPLMRNLFENDTYRRMYIAHLRTIIEENFANQYYSTRGQLLQGLIVSSVLADTNKFYTDTDFYANLNTTTTDLVDYPGITDLMDARTTYLQSYPGYQGAPDISNISHTPQVINVGDDIWITADVNSTETVSLAYRYGGSGLFQTVEMLDDGTQNDGTANDGIYGIQLMNIGSSVQYYLYAENSIAGRFSPERAAYEYYVIQSEISAKDLVINEFMADNVSTVTDNSGKYDDWIELYNNTPFELSTAGLYLSDDATNLKKWPMPDILIPTNGYQIVWADEDGGQVGLHANFKLSSAGEIILLSDENGAIIDSVSFGPQQVDIAYARIPNGVGNFDFNAPSFNGMNTFVSNKNAVLNTSISIYPNPASRVLHMVFEHEKPQTIHLSTIDGKLIYSANQINQNKLEIPLNEIPAGFYFVDMTFEKYSIQEKIIIEKK